ncbi:peptidoglycan-binding protein LysM [bacterium]|nr:peptidoglycan-binding protein LysM [bacterium]
MRNSKKIIGFFFAIFIFSAFSKLGRMPINEQVIQFSFQEVIKLKPKIEIVTSKIDIKQSHKNFLSAIGRRESSNRYDIINRYGYMGKYQFGRKTLNAIGFKNISNSKFISSPRIQEAAMITLLRVNKKNLRRQIKRHVGTVVNGVYITESGLLAGAHLAGAGNVKKWLRNGKRFKDGLGTSVVSYIELFGGYKLDL